MENIKACYDQSTKSNAKIDKIISLLDQLSSESESTNESTKSDLTLSPMTYLLIGIISGSIASVILVAYINK